MPQLALAHSLWEGYDALEKPIKAGVHKAMDKFQRLTAAELYADKGLHLESVENARDSAHAHDPPHRLLARRGPCSRRRQRHVPPLEGPTARRRLLLGRQAHLQPQRSHPRPGGPQRRRHRTAHAAALEKSAAEASAFLFSDVSDTVLRDLGIDEQVLSRSPHHHQQGATGGVRLAPPGGPVRGAAVPGRGLLPGGCLP